MVEDPSGSESRPPRPGEKESLLATLERNRRTFAWKTADLNESGLRARTAASSLTLGGLIKHMALVEADWFAVKTAGQQHGEPWDSVDFDSDPDWEWTSSISDSPEELQSLWRAAVERSRHLLDEVIRERGLDGSASLTWPDGRTPTIRAMVLDMIEEYARHTGHADILRESVDERVGEGAPPSFVFF